MLRSMFYYKPLFLTCLVFLKDWGMGNGEWGDWGHGQMGRWGDGAMRNITSSFFLLPSFLLPSSLFLLPSSLFPLLSWLSINHYDDRASFGQTSQINNPRHGAPDWLRGDTAPRIKVLSYDVTPRQCDRSSLNE